MWVADRRADTAEEELRAPAAVHMRVRALNDILEAGEISLHEFEQEEERLLDLLEPPAPPAPAGRADATPLPGRHGCHRTASCSRRAWWAVTSWVAPGRPSWRSPSPPGCWGGARASTRNGCSPRA
ncbi:gas vesicle protein GvpG [Streptomyces sp. DSM 42041]|uniref:Gas vesicle protein GvpG n=1 Tax=Streptomyces hazeniae TaxID=3075538 RepID=A0ABU2NV56_9ACTN|nr:gas vesicle protein GvpG [Streptomyces sp. DSM 42041]MDT0380862.1 gas vesicle protein GvpG [Streptomyces sp. DSM 42041]